MLEVQARTYSIARHDLKKLLDDADLFPVSLVHSMQQCKLQCVHACILAGLSVREQHMYPEI